ncbi:DUF1349 domain-containing protein [Histomonas meleagridis]|uniref:DUF1349 domain-containing protein n=1 Tax=Histomonas meleagridis TaxID=135588 RepID=UPI003559DBB2|nr:DUF1349 domain-containing protein [Histomonas meleagridis]KAH0803648.1 DUF1349 domain-containing protein [Histomonas meleagridis]
MEGFEWLNPPEAFTVEGNSVKITTKEKTDFWQRTHYGFRNDNAHFFYKRIPGDFILTAECHFESNTLFDQCGLCARINEDNWIKTSTEYHDAETSDLGSVITNHGYSDWAKQEISSSQRVIYYKMQRKGQDFFIEASFDGKVYKEIRVGHIFDATGEIMAGVYACSPQRGGFQCEIKNIQFN